MAFDPGTNNVVISYLTLRRIVGVLGMALPPVVAVWGCILNGNFELLPSISDYYDLRTRDVFVGVFFTVAWFLFTYRGYTREDDWAGNLACIFALCVALFPKNGGPLEHIVHNASAAGFFLVLAYFSLCLFTKSGQTQTPRKKQRNIVYRWCGIVMVASIVLIAVYHMTGEPAPINQLKPVFWLETAAVWAFGISWFVKGEAILAD